MTRYEQILIGIAGVCVALAGVTTNAQAATPYRLNPVYEAEANRWHLDRNTRFNQQYNIDGPASQRWNNRHI